MCSLDYIRCLKTKKVRERVPDVCHSCCFTTHQGKKWKQQTSHWCHINRIRDHFMQKGGLIELWINVSVLYHIQTSDDRSVMGVARESQSTKADYCHCALWVSCDAESTWVIRRQESRKKMTDNRESPAGSLPVYYWKEWMISSCTVQKFCVVYCLEVETC